MKRGKFLIFLLPLFTLLILPRVVLAETKTFEAQKDTYANEAYPDKVNGDFGSITISNKFTTRLGYLDFGSIDLPEGAIFDNGVLKFYVHERHYADYAKLNVGPVTGNWEENSLTWNNKPTINQTQAIEAEISLTEDGWKEINVTDLVSRWLEGTSENKGFFLYPLGYLYGSPDTEFALSFKSKEAGESTAKLELEYHLSPTPTPTLEPTAAPSPQPEETQPAETIIPTEMEEESTPTLEESPAPTTEATKSPFLTLNLSPGQTIIAGLLVLTLIGSVVGFALTSRRQIPQSKPKLEKEEKEEDEEK